MISSISFHLCWHWSENLFVCFGTKPTQRAWGRDLPQDRKWRKEGRSQRRQRVSWQRIAEENSRLEIAVQRRTQSTEGGSEKMEVGQSRDESAFLVALWKFRKIHAHDSLQMHGELHKSVTNSLLLHLELTQVCVCSFVPPSQLCFVRICKEMCNVPGRRWEKTTGWITGHEWFGLRKLI